MKNTAIIFSVIAAAFSLTSCSNNGDPHTGGIFWNENVAQDRLQDRQDTLEGIERRTGKTNRSSAQTQRQIDALR